MFVALTTSDYPCKRGIIGAAYMQRNIYPDMRKRSQPEQESSVYLFIRIHVNTTLMVWDEKMNTLVQSNTVLFRNQEYTDTVICLPAIFFLHKRPC